MPQRRNGRYAHLGTDTTSAEAVTEGADPEAIGDLVRAVLAAGDAVLFGITRDGGSARIILMSGDERTSVYLKSPAEIDTYCRTVRDHVRNTLL